MSKLKLLKSTLILNFIFPLIVTACSQGELTYSPEYIYSFDSTVIFEKINTNAGEAIFEKQEKIPKPTEPTHYILWDSDQYWQVINSFMTEVIGEPMSIWSISSISYNGLCSDVSEGFIDNSVFLFKTNKGFPDQKVMEMVIRIDPSGGYIDYYEKSYEILFSNLKKIDLGNMKVAPEKAIIIAENNGGSKEREKSNNSCTFSLLLGYMDNPTEWDVSYSDLENSQYIYHSSINYVTGFLKRLRVPSPNN